jgi:hypothetical protein
LEIIAEALERLDAVLACVNVSLVGAWLPASGKAAEQINITPSTPLAKKRIKQSP